MSRSCLAAIRFRPIGPTKVLKPGEGSKPLESLEATTDRLGHVELRISLSHQHPEDNWKVEIPIFLDAGSLEQIAARARRFFE